MDELQAWMVRQSKRERRVVRLEDALLGGRFARYFVHRLRFFVARTAVSTLVHALKIVLLLGAFPRTQFVFIVVLLSSLAVFGDLWWGALEQMRTKIRELQRRASRHLVPRQIAAWLSLSVVVAGVGIGAASVYVGYRLVVGGLGPAEALVAALVVGASLDLVARTFHSGAYAMRRVYRPLPSLLALDVVSVGVLLALFPLVGLWAFPIAELLSVLTVVGISIYFTSRTYRTLALPTMGALLLGRASLRGRRRLPSLADLRAAVAPGVAYALVGLEGLVVVAGVFGGTTASGENLVALLAALAPVNRASFEWARLLYFDLKRLGLPLLASLRARFDRATLWLALVMAAVTWAVAAVVGALVLTDLTPLLVVGLLAMFVARSLLAAVQMQAFTRPAYLRLTVVGLLGVVGVVAVFLAFPDAATRIFLVAAVLGLSFVLLLALPPTPRPTDGVVPLAEWLGRLRSTRGPVKVTRLAFDERLDARGTIVEKRRAEGWRRSTVAQRLGVKLVRSGGCATWITPTLLWLFEPGSELSPIADAAVGIGAGLIAAPPQLTSYVAGVEASADLGAELLGVAPFTTPVAAPSTDAAGGIDRLIADFLRRFPTGIAYDLMRPAPSMMTRLASTERVAIYRAALLFARDLRRGRGQHRWEVTSLAVDGSLRAIFVADQRAPEQQRRSWRHAIRAWTLRAAAGLPANTPVASRTSEPANAAPEAPML